MNMRKYMSNMRELATNDVLGLIGLQRHSSGDWIFPMLAGVGAGLAIGAGLALALTPYRGEELRQRMRRSASDAQRKIEERVGQLGEKVGLTEIKGTATIPANVSTQRTVGVGGINTGSTGGNRGGF